ncbi:MAG TPA: GNAT family N-acetyltransferase [Fimbriimonadaceae bacterium]|nr:GNAT family N-acetyltransferase [Fimbriimonadaceae bacterium]
MDPSIRHAAPILPTRDVQATLDWYEQKCGATGSWTYGEPPHHAGCSLGSAQIQLTKSDATLPEFEMFVFVSNIPALYEDYVRRGVEIESELEHKPWTATEFSVVDPNGVRLRFAEFRDKPEKKAALEGVTYRLRHLTKEEHEQFYRAVGWDGSYNNELTPERLCQSPLVTVVAEYEGRAIGAASISGNGVEAFIVRDVIVLPEYQGRGVGTGVMKRLMDWTEANVPKGANVILQTGGGAPSFYEGFGFIGTDKGLLGMYFTR